MFYLRSWRGLFTSSSHFLLPPTRVISSSSFDTSTNVFSVLNSRLGNSFRLSDASALGTEHKDGPAGGTEVLSALTLEQALCVRVVSSLKKLIQRKKNAQVPLQNEMVLAEKAEATNKRAQLISGSLTNSLPSWTTKLQAMDWETGETVTLLKDPKYGSFQEESKKLFALSRRMKRGSQAVRDLLVANQQAVTELEDAAEALEAGESVADWKQTLLKLGLKEGDFNVPVQTPKVIELTDAATKPKSPFRTFQGPDGSVILVGRNSRENDQLSVRVAKDRDVWMHSRNTPGAHVIVQSSSSKIEPSAETLQLAADLAIFYSEARDSRKALVLVAKARHVIKFKGAPIGAVRVRLEEPSLFGFPGNVPEECVLAREKFSDVNRPSKKKDTTNRQKKRRRV